MQILITLNEPLGANLGPFDLTANIGTVIPSTATRSQLLAGYEVTVSDSATQIIINSDSSGLCDTSTLILNITGIPIEEPNVYYLSLPRSINDEDTSDGGGCVDIYDYCVSPGYETTIIVYADTIDSTITSLLGVTLYTNALLTTPFIGLGTNIRYAVSTVYALNTFISGPTEYKLIEVNNIGEVTTIEENPCNCFGTGEPVV